MSEKPVEETKYPACSFFDCLSLADFRFVLLGLAGSTCAVKPNEDGYNKCRCYKDEGVFHQWQGSEQPPLPGENVFLRSFQFDIPTLKEIKASKNSTPHLSA